MEKVPAIANCQSTKLSLLVSWDSFSAIAALVDEEKVRENKLSLPASVYDGNFEDVPEVSSHLVAEFAL